MSKFVIYDENLKILDSSINVEKVKINKNNNVTVYLNDGSIIEIDGLEKNFVVIDEKIEGQEFLTEENIKNNISYLIEKEDDRDDNQKISDLESKIEDLTKLIEVMNLNK